MFDFCLCICKTKNPGLATVKPLVNFLTYNTLLPLMRPLLQNLHHTVL